jgi:Subtilase family
VLVAPDGINVDAAGTYFEGELFPDGNFYGTSASVPNAAAVGALIRGAFPFLTASQLVSALKAGAAQLGTVVPDGTFGYGRVDAMGALATFAAPTITSLPDSAINAGASSPSYSFTVTGTGPLHFTITSSNTSSIPAAVVAAGSPGVTITPADCGTSTLTCSLSVTAANGAGGTVTVTVAAVDGANRSATDSMKVNVTGNQTAPSNSTPQPSTGSGGGGGALDWWVIAVLLLGSVHTTRRARA